MVRSLAERFRANLFTGKPSRCNRTPIARSRLYRGAAIAAIQPGISAEDMFFTCRADFAKEGLRFMMPHVGHGFGLELHEFPMLRPGNKTVLKTGMVLNVEPVTIDPDRSGYQLEDLALVTAGGSRLLTLGLAPPEIPVIGTRPYRRNRAKGE